MIFIVVRFTVRPERTEEWLGIVGDFTTAVRAEPGNVFFDLSKSVDDPNKFVLVEGYVDAEAGSAHVTSDHFKAAMAALPAVISAKPEIINVEIPQAGWSEMAELTPSE